MADVGLLEVILARAREVRLAVAVAADFRPEAQFVPFSAGPGPELTGVRTVHSVQPRHLQTIDYLRHPQIASTTPEIPPSCLSCTWAEPAPGALQPPTISAVFADRRCLHMTQALTPPAVLLDRQPTAILQS